MDRNLRRRIRRAEKNSEKRIKINEGLIETEQIIAHYSDPALLDVLEISSVKENVCELPAENVISEQEETNATQTNNAIDFDNSPLNSESECSVIDESEQIYYDALDDDLPPIVESDCESENDWREDLSEYSVPERKTVCEKIVDCLRDCASTSGDFKQALMNNLLATMRNKYPEEFAQLPKDARTVMKTPRTVNLESMENGKFSYLGLAKYLLQILALNKVFALGCENFDLLFNIDGLPIFKSTKLQVWPILCRVHGLNLPPFAVAIFCGTSKPPLQEYLKQFICELKGLLESGLKFGNKLITVHVLAFICDAPAKSYLKGVKNHNSYWGCDRCNQKGAWRGRVVFLESNSPIISDMDFYNKTFPNHQIEETPLLHLRIGLVSCFPCDYMHLTCLGVVRRLLFLWRDGTKYHTKVFSQNICGIINAKLESIKECWPSDFNRKPRPLSDLERWKATELRFFLLYCGPIVLKKALTKAAYDNFMCLHVAMFILLDDNLNTLYNDYANNLLHLYVKTCSTLYGEELLVYNTHGLLHLSSDAKRFGKLDNISAFPFENYLGSLKRLLRNANNPVCQIVKRLDESSVDKFIIKNNNCFKFVENSKIAKTASDDKQFYSVAYINQQRFANDLRDRAFLLNNGKVFLITKIAESVSNEAMIYGKTLKRAENFYEYPLSSENMQVYQFDSISSNAQTNEHVVRIADIKCKGCFLPYKSSFVFIPMHERI